jgi:hypothetical protein
MTEQPTSSPPDITARLRREAQELWFEGGRDSDRQLMLEAANEIERLRVALARYGWHHENCPYLESVTACICGYDALRIADHAAAVHSSEVQR